MRQLGALLLLAFVLVDAASAQTVGHRVELVDRSGSLIQGLVQEVSKDGLTLDVPNRGLMSVAYADMLVLVALVPAPDGIVRLYTRKYAVRGAAGGAAILGLAGVIAFAEEDEGAGRVALAALGGAAIGGGGGAIVGTLLGRLAKLGRWEPIVLPGTDAALIPAIPLHGMGMPAVGLTLAF